MIDIHTHIMPKVDDGAGSFEEMLMLVRMAYENGTKGIVLTPHCAPFYGYYNNAEDIREKFRYVKYVVQETERIPIRLYSGMEVLFREAEEMKREYKNYLTINGSRYLLLEFMFDADRRTFLNGIHCARECGFVPVVAHPERYDCVQKGIEILESGRKMGAVFQMNKGSLSGRYGKQERYTAHALLKEHMVQVIASDTHDTVSRTPVMTGVRKFLEDVYGRQYTKELLFDNPRRILQNQKILNVRGNESK